MRLAVVGVGGRGQSHVKGHFEAGAELVAFCDVDAARAAESFALFPKVPRFRDYRQMLDQMGDKIDALSICTPDHMHYPIAILAINRGKHVYLEKPLTHTVAECRALKKAALRAGVVTQMGNQGHANNGCRLVKEWIAAGLLGKISEVHAFTNRPIWPQGLALKKSEKPPETLDWNLWQGVADEREFSPGIVPFNWRGYWEYGCGAFGDMACHILDGAFFALDLRGNCKVSAKVDADPSYAVTAPKGSTVIYDFPARGDRGPLKLYWYDGSHRPPVPPELGPDAKIGRNGCFIRGEKGIIIDQSTYWNEPRLYPVELNKRRAEIPQSIRRIPGGNQWREFLDAIHGVGPAPGSNFVDHAADLTEMTHLGNIAIRAGRAIEWDAEKAVCVNDPAATRFVTKAYRKF
ncbi:MAG: Gfo/Idh/MocA family oxidoreductase [Opitutaceae bacterium]|nr:Gfo/Idh/MocA family oxidoreductase [Opitutaceae bacterium]